MKIVCTDLFQRPNAQRPLVVGVIGTKIELTNATMAVSWPKHTLRPVTDLRRIDIFEIRLDMLVGFEREIEEFLAANEMSSAQKPIIITARDSSEGGAQPSWTQADRLALYREYMPHATLIDIEASQAAHLLVAIDEAHRSATGIILSAHYLDGFPELSSIKTAAEQCRYLKGRIFKVAARCETVKEHLSLHAIAEDIRCNPSIFPFEVTVMATGERFGCVSRHFDVIHGGSFVYGYIDNAVVPGQPKAINVKKALEGIRQ
jgi:3-dehydroquinate dehydratase type I